MEMQQHPTFHTVRRLTSRMRPDSSAGRLSPLVLLAAALIGTDYSDASAQTIPGPPKTVRVYAGSATAPAVTITISPAAPSIQPGATIQFVATVAGTSNKSIVWGATGGSITSAGAYTAGQTTGS